MPACAAATRLAPAPALDVVGEDGGRFRCAFLSCWNTPFERARPVRAFRSVKSQVFRELDDVRGVAGSLTGLGDVARDRGDSALGIEYSEEGVTLAHELGDTLLNGYGAAQPGDGQLAAR